MPDAAGADFSTLCCSNWRLADGGLRPYDSLAGVD